MSQIFYCFPEWKSCVIKITEKNEMYFKDGSEEVEFNAWAFGDFYQPHNSNFAMLRWNERHGHLLMLKPDGLIADDLPKMILLWRTREEMPHLTDQAAGATD